MELDRKMKNTFLQIVRLFQTLKRNKRRMASGDVMEGLENFLTRTMSTFRHIPKVRRELNKAHNAVSAISKELGRHGVGTNRNSDVRRFIAQKALIYSLENAADEIKFAARKSRQ